MKNSVAIFLFRAGFFLTILFLTFLIVYLVRVEFEVIHGETGFFITVLKTIFVLPLIYFSFLGLGFFSNKVKEQEQEIAS